MSDIDKLMEQLQTTSLIDFRENPEIWWMKIKTLLMAILVLLHELRENTEGGQGE